MWQFINGVQRPTWVMCSSPGDGVEKGYYDGGDDSATKGVDLEAIDFYVCVLTGLRDGTYDWIMRWWSSKPQAGIVTILYSVAYFH